MEILIIGGNGYIGSKLGLALKEKGHKVESFDLPRNILNKEEIEGAIKGKDVVYHLAALAEISYTDAHPQETYDVNIEGTNNVARICAENNVLLNFSSTCCLYGDPLDPISTEEGRINPTDTYAMSKAAGEYLIKMWGLSSGLRYNIMRFGTVYGQSLNPSMRGDMCIQKFLEAATKKERVFVTGDGNQSRNFVHVDDLVRGLVLLNESSVEGEIINFGGNESISVNDIADYAVGFGVTGVDYVAPRKDDFSDQNVSLEKAKRLLGWEPEIKFKDGIKSFYEWLNR